MKCPKCGYHSFEHLDNCKKCGQDLTAHKAKYKLRGYTISAATAVAAAGAEQSVAATDSADEESIDFGFDFLAEDEEQSGADRSGAAHGGEHEELSLDQPFDIGSEALPGDPAAGKEKSAKGSEFAF